MAILIIRNLNELIMKDKNIALLKSDYFVEKLQSIEADNCTYTQTFISRLITAQRSFVEEYIEILEHCKNSIKALDSGTDKVLLFWRLLSETIEKLLTHTDSSSYIDSELTASKFWEEWKTTFKKQSDTIAVFGKFYIPDELLHVNSADSVRIKVWKRLNRVWHVVGNKMRSVTYTLGSIFRKKKKVATRKDRLVALRRFYRFYYELPAAENLMNLWFNYLQRVIEQFELVNEATEKTIDELLFMRDFKEACFNAEIDKVAVIIDNIEKNIGIFRQYANDINEIEKYLWDCNTDSHSKLTVEIKRAWNYIGTPMLPNSGISTREIRKSWKKLENRYDDKIENWKEYLLGKRQSFKKDLELSVLQVKTITICIETIYSNHQKVFETILPLIFSAKEDITNSLEAFKNIEIDQEAELRKKIIAENRLTLRTLRREKLPQAIDAIIESNLMKALQNYHSRIKHAIDNLPDSHRIIEKEDIREHKPEFKSVQIPLKNLVNSEIYVKWAANYQKFLTEYQTSLDRLTRDISEIDEIVEFNLDAAISLLEKSDAEKDFKEAEKVLIEGYNRASKQFEVLEAQSHELIKISDDILTNTSFGMVNDIQGLVDNDKIIALQFRIARVKTRGRLKRIFDSIIDFFRNIIPGLLTFFIKSSDRLNENVQKIRKMVGLMPIQEESRLRLSKYLSETQQKMVTLPFIYQRLFRMEPFKDERFFEGREEELKMIEETFASWRNGNHNAIMIVGESGSGKTTLLHFAKTKIIKSYKMTHICLENKFDSTDDLLRFLIAEIGDDSIVTWTDLENMLMKDERSHVFIIENLHNLFIRTINGFDVIERFLLFIARTGKSIFWIVTCGLYAFDYLDRIVRISEYFSHVCAISDLSREHIINIILKRHRVSGFKLQFEEFEQLHDNRRFKKLATTELKQEYIRNLFFDRLHRLSGGNVTVAMLFWMQAISKIEADTFIVSQLNEIDTSSLQQRDINDDFTLAAYLQHEKLTPQQYADIFNLSIQDACLIINRLKNIGFLIETKSGYRINYLLQKSIARILKKKNILL